MRVDTSVILAILAASVTLIGWVVNYILTGRDEQRKKQLDASLGYLESQLQELYGPLAFHIQASRRTHQDLLNSLGRDQVFVPGQELTEDELKTWLFWIENDIFPRHDKMMDLLTTKTHLIEGQQVPQSYLDFMEHHNSWKINHMRWQKDNVKYSWRSSIPFPDAFEKDVLTTFERLKQKHAQMLGVRHADANALVLQAQSNPPSSSQEK